MLNQNIITLFKKAMEHNAVKLELIEWLASLEDDDTIEYLKVAKDSRISENNWWNELSREQREGIERGLNDIDEGRVVSYDEVKTKYGL